MGDGVVVCDAAGKFLVFNPAAEQILGDGQTAGGREAWAEHYGLFLPDKRTRCAADQVPLALALQGLNR